MCMKRFLCIILSTILVFFSFSACGNEKHIKVYMPDGAPSLSMISLMANGYKIGEKSTNYEIVASDKIGGLVANKQADLAVLPLNLATKVCGEDYQILSVMTWGNLYILGKSGNIDDIVGNNLYVINLNNVPGLTTRLMLEKENIPYSFVEQSNNNIKLVATTANEVIGGFLSNKMKYAVVAEPAVSKIMTKVSGLSVIGDLQEIYGEYPQSVLVIKKNLLNNKNMQNLIAKLSENSDYLENNLNEIYFVLEKHLEKGLVSAFTEDLNNSLIQRCNVNFRLAVNERQRINDYILNLKRIEPNSCNEMASGVFYEII